MSVCFKLFLSQALCLPLLSTLEYLDQRSTLNSLPCKLLVGVVLSSRGGQFHVEFATRLGLLPEALFRIGNHTVRVQFGINFHE